MGQLKLWARVPDHLDSTGREVRIVLPLARGLCDIAGLCAIDTVSGEEGEGSVYTLHPVFRRYHGQLPFREEVVLRLPPERVQEHQIQRPTAHAASGPPGVPGAEEPVQPVYLLPGTESAYAPTVADDGREPAALCPAGHSWRRRWEGSDAEIEGPPVRTLAAFAFWLDISRLRWRERYRLPLPVFFFFATARATDAKRGWILHRGGGLPLRR